MKPLALTLCLLTGCAGMDIPVEDAKRFAAPVVLEGVRGECAKQEGDAVHRVKAEGGTANQAQLAVDAIRVTCDVAFTLIKRALHVD